MQIKTFLLLFSMLLFTAFSYSQITSGKVSYDVYLSTDNPQMASFIENMENSQLEISFSEDKIRTDMTIGEMSTTNTVTLKDEDTMLVLMDNMYLGKIAMKIAKDGIDKDSDEAKMYQVKEADLDSDETKEIMGYTCKKATLYMEDDSESVVWYTDAIVPPYREGQFLFEEIPGLPLEMQSKYFNMDLKIVAYEMKDKLKKKELTSLFSLEVPKGYTVKTPEELKQFQGGGRDK